ncbi:hypothetical protein ANO11243_003490 [Dothideomycetidae sp. 11243]|nr:hypothetical protein ANO11243_003490 [fungal sp. No.11243]
MFFGESGAAPIPFLRSRIASSNQAPSNESYASLRFAAQCHGETNSIPHGRTCARSSQTAQPENRCHVLANDQRAKHRGSLEVEQQHGAITAARSARRAEALHLARRHRGQCDRVHTGRDRGHAFATPVVWSSHQGASSSVGLLLQRCRHGEWLPTQQALRRRTDSALQKAFGATCVALGHVGYLNGLGSHIVELTYPELFMALKYLWLSIFVGLTGTWVAKLAIVAMLYQMATIFQPRRKAFLLSLGLLNSVVTFIAVMLSITQCEPVQFLWDKTLDGKCPRAHMASVYSYVQAGSSCAIAPIERSFTTRTLLTTSDPTYKVMPFNIWAGTELWLLLIIGTIPPLRPLFLHWFGKKQVPGVYRNELIGTISTPPKKELETPRVDELMSVNDMEEERIDHV